MKKIIIKESATISGLELHINKELQKYDNYVDITFNTFVDAKGIIHYQCFIVVTT